MTTENQQAVVKKELTQSERFMAKVISEFGSNVGEVALTNFQKRLAQNYFIALDSVLKTTEEKRLKKAEKFRDAVPVTWANVNMEKLASDVVAMARVGFDPSQPNHINPIPYKNKHLNKYDITFIEGYRGLELKAKKYGLDVPDHVTVELVYSTDKFKAIKKDAKNEYDGYEFDIVNAFDRGEVVGGFYYHLFSSAPVKNRIVVMTKKDIDKRKPEKASAEFWGGEKDKWENNKKVGTEKVEGWYDQMAWKTVYRAAFNDITIDSQKIDDDYLRLKQMESDLTEAEVAQEIGANANGDIIDITPDPATSTNASQNQDPGPQQEGLNQDEMDFSGDVPPMKETGGGPGF